MQVSGVAVRARTARSRPSARGRHGDQQFVVVAGASAASTGSSPPALEPSTRVGREGQQVGVDAGADARGLGQLANRRRRARR